MTRTHTKLLIRAILLGLSLASTAGAVLVFADLLASNGYTLIDLPLAVLFSMLFFWVALSFWTAIIGFMQVLRHHPHSLIPVRREPEQRLPRDKLPVTSILMPIYNESPDRVFAGIRAMIDSLADHGVADRFDVFILSDSTDPVVWLSEERALQQLLDEIEPETTVHYRRRRRNIARKSGNIEEWCERFGERYKHMVILDADSIVSGGTLVEMVQRMERDPKLGILQVPPVPVNRDSLFARLQQFAASVYSELFTTGFAIWTQQEGNYYGHNAIIRVKPFIEHCGLPMLPGTAPLGGEILSHDFVEAALIRRAGWKVQVAHDLGGSYEECPTTIIDFAKRDQRWCQGNLQHVRLLFAYGFHPVSRVHLGMGAMSYVASPLWLLFMVLTVIAAMTGSFSPHGGSYQTVTGATLMLQGVLLFIATMSLLLIPRFLALALLVRDPHELTRHGGEAKVTLGVLLEMLVSALMAPILMLYHTRFVVSNLMGRSVQWSAQRRDEASLSFTEACRTYASHTLVGVGATLLLAWGAPGLLPWALPVTLGLILAVPVSMLVASPRIGLALRHWGLLLIPEETDVPPALARQRELLDRQASQAPDDPLARVVYDPTFLNWHLALLAADDHLGLDPAEPVDFDALPPSVNVEGLHALDRADQFRVLYDESTLQRLHRDAWKTRPAEQLTL